MILLFLLASAVRAQSPAAPAEDVSTDVAVSTEVPLMPWETESFVRPSTPSAPQYRWTLEDVTKLALENNPDLQSAEANAQAAQAVLGESWSGYLPRIDATGFTTKAAVLSLVSGSAPEAGTFAPYAQAIVGFQQTVFDFGKALEQIKAARALGRSSEQEYQALYNLVRLNAERAFYDVAAAQELVQVAQKSLAQFRETYRRAVLMVRTGVRPSFDLTQAQVQYAKAELALINARNARDLARIALLNIMGQPRQVSFQLAPEISTAAVRANRLDMQKLTDVALGARPEMKAARSNLDQSKDQLRAVERDYLPSIYASGWYGRFAPDYPESIRESYGIGLSAGWNLFGGFSTTYRVKELKARLDQQQALLKRQSQRVVAEVAAGYMNLMRAEQNETVASDGLKFAQENFDYAQQRYNNNVGTILELLIAETSLVNADADLVQARYRVATALAALRQAVNAPLTENP